MRAVRCQGSQRHPEITRRYDIDLGPQPARRTTVVGDGDDRGDVRREPARSRQRRIQTVPTAHRDDARVQRAGRRTRGRRGGHSRPRSRCRTRTESWESSLSSPASASAMATLRCFPPVQPMATVMYLLPSRV